MKTIALLLSLLLAACQLNADKVPAFQKGKRYTYDFKTRVATGIADDVHQLSGFGLKGHLIVQNVNDEVVFKVKDVEVGTINSRMEHLMEELPIEYSKPEGDQATMVREMEKPFWVEFDHGVIKSLHFDKDDHTPDYNVKKAIAALFQTDFRKDVEDLHIYHVVEDGIGGVCDTIYNVGHYHDDDAAHSHDDFQVMNVTKLRSYDNCTSRPHLLHTSFIGEMCRECSQENFRPLNTMGRVEYGLKGNREHFEIQYIYSNGGIVFSPFTTNGQTVYSVVNQTLYLVKVEDATPISKPGAMEEVTSLSYTFNDDHHDYKNVDLKKAHYYDRIYDGEYPERMAEAERYYSEMKAIVKDYGKESRYVGKFVRLFYKFSYDDFVQFFTKNVLNDDKGMKSFMFEVLPLVGTNPAIVYTIELIESGKVGKTDAFEMIQKVPFYVKEPSMKLLVALKTAGMKKVITDDKKLFAASRLSFGTLIFRACVEHLHNPHPHGTKTYIDESTCATMVQDMITKFKQFTDSQNAERSIYLRAISNTRTEQALDFLLYVVKEHKYETLLRQTAIWGMAPYIEDYPEKVAHAVAPILYDVDEDYILRIYAFEVYLYARPTPTFFGNLLVCLGKERSEKLKSYVYSTLATLANSTDPCDEDYVYHAEQVMKFLEHRERDIIRDPVNRIFSVYNGKFNYGRTSQFVMIPNNDSVIPRELYMRQAFNLMGTNFDFFEFGYMSEGRTMFDQFLTTEMGPKGLREYGQKLENPSLREVVSKLHLKDAISHDIHDYEIYMKIFNQDIFVTRDLVNDIKARSESSEITYDNGKLNMNVHSVGYMEGEFLIPNELGLPVSIKVNVPVAYHIGGNGRFTPKMDDKTHHLRGFNAEYNLRLAMDFTVYSHVSVEGKMYEHFGVALKTQGGVKVPLKGSVDVDLETKKTAFKYVPSTTPYDVVYYKSVPYTQAGKDKKLVTYSPVPTNRQYHVGHDFWGVGFTHNFTYDYHQNDYGSYRHFLKSFFKKASSYDDYFYLSDKWYAGTRNLLDYTFLNPTGKPFAYNMRYEPSETFPTTEFSLTTERTYNKNHDGNRGQTVFKYKAMLVGKGQTERKWNVDLHVSAAWPERDSKKVIFNYKRSPLPGYDNSPYEVCYKGDWLMTDWEKVYTTSPTDLKTQWKGAWKMGQTCESGDAKTITISAVGEKSEEQLSIEKSSLPQYRKCQDLTKKGQELNKYCWRVIKENGRLDKFTFDIDFKNIPDKVKGKFYRMYSWFRHYFYDNLEIDPFHGSGQENHIKIVANFSYYYPELDIKVLRPEKTVYYHNIWVPSVLPTWTPFTVAVPMWERWLERVYNYHIPKCFINSKYIRTFDDVLYKAPIGDCWYLAFSDAADHHVHVLYRAVKDTKDKKALKVLWDSDEVEIVPHGDKYTVMVNGKEQLTDKSAYIHTVDDQIHFVVYKYGHRYVVGSKYYGVFVYYDGVKSMIRSLNFYRGIQRGLCGNFDGEKYHEYVGPNGHVYHDSAEFTRSYGIQKDGCTLH